MKRSITCMVALLAGAFVVHAQGTVSFANYAAFSPYIYVSLGSIRIGGSSQVTTGDSDEDTGNGDDWTVALYGNSGLDDAAVALVRLDSFFDAPTPVTAPCADWFIDHTAGTWFSSAWAKIPGTTGVDQPATVQVRAWYNDGGKYTTYEAAVAAGIPTGVSSTGNITTGGAQRNLPPLIPPFLPDVGNIALSGQLLTPEPSGSAGGFDYSGTWASTNITLIGYHGTNPVVSIPTAINKLQVTNIGAQTFFNCSTLTSITIPGSVTSVGQFAFEDCANLTNVNIQNGVISLGQGAFYDCDKLTSVTIPGTVTSAAGAFEGCLGLVEISTDSTNPVFTSVNGILFNKNVTALVEYPNGLVGGYTIPDSVTNIADFAFIECVNLSGVTIPAHVANIGNQAFASCPALASVYFEGDAPLTASSSFSGDSYATGYYVPDTVGWAEYSTLTGLQTLEWKPFIETTAASFGVRANGFGFNVFWASNRTAIVEASTKLADAVWEPVQTNSLVGGSFYFFDPQWSNYPARYYRITVR